MKKKKNNKSLKARLIFNMKKSHKINSKKKTKQNKMSI